jgi:polyisoprenoid-binding protein YceI
MRRARMVGGVPLMPVTRSSHSADMLRHSNRTLSLRRDAVSKVRVHSLERPRSLRMVPLAALSLGAALVLGATNAYAQAADEPAAGGIDGFWAVDTEIGDFEEFTSSWVGFRVNEVLNPGGEVQAVGRTPVVSGQLEAAGTVIESAVIEADLTAIISDRPRRDDAIQRALGTDEFPVARFTSSAPVDLGAIPVEGEPFTASVPGSITIRDVSQDVTLELTGQRVGDVVVVVGALPVDFTSFGVTMPTAPIVVSVEDSGDLEWQLFLTRAADPATDQVTDDPAADEAVTDDGTEEATSEG